MIRRPPPALFGPLMRPGLLGLLGLLGLFGLFGLFGAPACADPRDPGPVDAGTDAGGDGDGDAADAADGAAGSDGADPGGDADAPPCGRERVRQDLAIPTLDGHALSAFVDRPAQDGCALPTILLQTPYDKDSAWSIFFGEERAERPLFASPHYNYVVVDWRGFHGSEDLPHPGDGAWMAQDSYDTVVWIAEQDWSDGQVGTWGVSALCRAQYRTAAGPIRNAQHPDFADGPPPPLRAMVPIMCALRNGFDETYPGGVMRHEWAMALDILGFGLRRLFEENPRHNLLWDLVAASVPAERIRVPALVVSGWWDLMPSQTVAAYQELRADSDPAVRDQHRLLIGPWIHFAVGGATSQGAARPLTAAEQVYMDLERRIDRDALAFFDHHLRGLDNEVADWAAVRYHHENAGWQAAAQWPPAALSSRSLYLDDQARLVAEPPDSGSLELSADAADPSPSLGGATLSPYACVGADDPLACMLTPDEDRILLHGPLSQAALLERTDQITFSSQPLAEPLVLLGRLRLHLDLRTDAADSDIALRVLDIDAQGDPRLIADGIQRLSARAGPRAYAPVEPGRRTSITVAPIKDFAYTIPAGHRLGLMISAHNFPLFARNPCDGAVFVRGDALDATAETFSYGSPPTEVALKGQPTSVHNTLLLDGSSRLEFDTR